MPTVQRPTQSVKLIDADEVAEALGCSVRTVRRMTTERRIPFAKLGSSVRFRPADVEQYIASHMVEAAK